MNKILPLIAVVFGCTMTSGQVTYERLLDASAEPENWLTYSGNYSSHRYSRLDEINRRNANRLELKWVRQLPTLANVETTPS